MMRIRIRSNFTIQVDARSVKTYSHGEYAVPDEMPKHHADMAVKLGSGIIIHEKKAPENKLVDVSENKAKVAKKPVRRGRPRSKPKS